MNLENHPCFNDKKRHLVRCVHLPVAPKCNIQCNYCVRKFDCINESKPQRDKRDSYAAGIDGVLEKSNRKECDISVAGMRGTRRSVCKSR